MRIAIIAQAVALRAGLRTILTNGMDRSESRQDYLEVVYEAGSLEEFLIDLPRTDVMIVQGELLGAPDLDQITQRLEGQLSILALSENIDVSSRLMTLPVLAWGILPPDASEDELLAAVLAVGQGLLVGSPNLIKPIISTTLVAETAHLELSEAILTERESQVLQLLALGLANKQIAQKLTISEHTVKFHISSIYAKLGVTNRTEAVRAGVRHGLITL